MIDCANGLALLLWEKGTQRYAEVLRDFPTALETALRAQWVECREDRISPSDHARLLEWAARYFQGRPDSQVRAEAYLVNHGSSSEWAFEQRNEPDAATVESIDRILIAWNEQNLAMRRTAFTIVARRQEEFVGGVYVRMYPPSAVVDYLAVAENSRRRGLGARLLLAAELEIRRRGCSRIFVDTMEYQAPEFYKKHGFEMRATLERYYGERSRIILAKSLA